jgi:hypothetical protein
MNNERDYLIRKKTINDIRSGKISYAPKKISQTFECQRHGESEACCANCVLESINKKELEKRDLVISQIIIDTQLFMPEAGILADKIIRILKKN